MYRHRYSRTIYLIISLAGSYRCHLFLVWDTGTCVVLEEAEGDFETIRAG